jgi:hypothetical protein
VVATLRPELLRGDPLPDVEPTAHFWEWPMGGFTNTGHIGKGPDAPDSTAGRRRLDRAAERIAEALLGGKDDRWHPPVRD